MKRPHGITLWEMLVVLLLLGILLNALAFASARLYDTHRRVTLALGDLEVAERFLRELKGDLHRARAVEAQSDRLAISFEDGSRALYRVEPEEGTVRRTGDGPDRLYVAAFGGVTFRNAADRVVAVDVELHKQDPQSPYHARWRTLVGWPAGGGGR